MTEEEYGALCTNDQLAAETQISAPLKSSSMHPLCLKRISKLLQDSAAGGRGGGGG